MALWTIAFDATVTVSVEADTEDDAVSGAEGIVERGEGAEGAADYSIGKIFMIRNEETGDEIIDGVIK